jgi:hypothetical protein
MMVSGHRRLAVVLRKDQHGISAADEHDSERIAEYGREAATTHGLSCRLIRPSERATLESTSWDGFLFVGADDFSRQFIQRHEGPAPLFMWAKGYDLTIDPQWATALSRLAVFFNSSYLSAVDDRYNERTVYVPTAFHEPWPMTVRDTRDDLRNRFTDPASFDLVFSGSDRHVRTDRYRQRLLNLLTARGLRILIAAPRSVWNRPHQFDAGETVPLDPAIAFLGNWGTDRVFRRARMVLDLPWLDNVFPVHPPHHDPDRTIFALGWNIFRAGAAGACVLTHDCPANRALGLDGTNAVFYERDLTDLEALADELTERLRSCTDDVRARCRERIGRLFHERHTYRERWAQMTAEIARWFSRVESPLARVGSA